LRDNTVRLEFLIGGDSTPAPTIWAQLAGSIGQHVAAAVHTLPCHHDADLVSVVALALSARGIDRNNDTLQVWRLPDAMPIDDIPRPKRIRQIIEDLCIQFLSAEPGALILLAQAVEEFLGQVRSIVEG